MCALKITSIKINEISGNETINLIKYQRVKITAILNFSNAFIDLCIAPSAVKSCIIKLDQDFPFYILKAKAFANSGAINVKVDNNSKNIILIKTSKPRKWDDQIELSIEAIFLGEKYEGKVFSESCIVKKYTNDEIHYYLYYVNDNVHIPKIDVDSSKAESSVQVSVDSFKKISNNIFNVPIHITNNTNDPIDYLVLENFINPTLNVKNIQVSNYKYVLLNNTHLFIERLIEPNSSTTINLILELSQSSDNVLPEINPTPFVSIKDVIYKCKNISSDCISDIVIGASFDNTLGVYRIRDSYPLIFKIQLSNIRNFDIIEISEAIPIQILRDSSSFEIVSSKPFAIRVFQQNNYYSIYLENINNVDSASIMLKLALKKVKEQEKIELTPRLPCTAARKTIHLVIEPSEEKILEAQAEYHQSDSSGKSFDVHLTFFNKSNSIIENVSLTKIEVSPSGSVALKTASQYTRFPILLVSRLNPYSAEPAKLQFELGPKLKTNVPIQIKLYFSGSVTTKKGVLPVDSESLCEISPTILKGDNTSIQTKKEEHIAIVPGVILSIDPKVVPIEKGESTVLHIEIINNTSESYRLLSIENLLPLNILLKDKKHFIRDNLSLIFKSEQILSINDVKPMDIHLSCTSPGDEYLTPCIILLRLSDNKKVKACLTEPLYYKCFERKK